MSRLSSPLKSSEETFDVVLSGGSPWGFTLQGGSEFRTKLSVAKITPGGKAELSQSIAVGDEIVAINGIDCISRSEAIELVRCSRQKLKIKLRREGGSGSGPARQSNGTAVKKSNDIVPNLYKTASEHFSNSDFYSTYNVDRHRFAQITQNNRAKNIYDSTDNLSASLDDLLESYRQSEKQPNITNSAIMDETKARLSNSSSEIANGRTSPSPEVDGLSGVSLPEGSWPIFHQRTHTSPGRIQKVTVKSTNISLSPQKESPPGRQNENQQTARSSVNRDDWVGRWLLDKPQRVTPINAANIPYKDKTKNKEKEKEVPDRRISMHERTEYENSKKSQSLPRSKSFGGPTSYGVTVTATAVKRNEGSSTLPPSRSPQRYSSSNLIQEKLVRAGNTSDSRLDDPSSRPIEMSRNSTVYAAPSDTVEVRLPRDMMGPKMTTSESTSSLDSVGTMDSNMGGARKQGPAPPPRRSVSKLLSSFRTQGRREVPQNVRIPPKFGAVSRLSEGASNQPIHSASRSWPTEHVMDSKTTGSENVRQSWHAEPAVMTGYSRRDSEANTSTSSDVTPERKLSKTPSIRCKSSVVIRNMRSSSSSSVDDNAGPTVYRSGQVTPEAEPTQSSYLPPKKKLSEGNSPVKSLGDAGGWMSQNRRPTESEKSRIEDTQILQRLILDKANNADPGPSVKSRIANFEGGAKRKTSGGAPSQEILPLQHRSFSQGRIDVLPQPLKSSLANQSSSMDSLLETRSPTKLNERSTNKNESRLETRSPTRFNETSTEKRGLLPENSPRGFNESSTKQQGSLPESRSPTRFSTTSTDSRGSVGESRSPTRLNTDRYETTPRIDKTSPKQWETNDNFIPSRRNENFKRPSSNTFSAKDSTDGREHRADNLYSPTRLEKQQEEPLRKVEASVDRAAPLNDKFLTSNIPPSVKQEQPPLSSNDDSEVFWDADDSFPPPPPLDLVDPLETSQDNLPLPSPPQEVLVEFPEPYSDYNLRSDPVEREPLNVSIDIPKREESVVESKIEIVEQSKVELNGPGKIDISDVSDPALETTSSTDSSFPDTSPTGNKKGTQRAPPPAPLLITSTPTKDDEPNETETPLDNSTSPYSLGSSTSTPSGSRPNSMMSPKLEALDKEKSDLVDSMKQKIIDLRSQMDEIKDEIDGNEQLGEKVTKVVERKASAAEFSKYQLFTGELNKIIGLLLILTQRMHRYEMMLNDLDMSEEADRQQKDILLSKIDKVTLQHEEACKIKEVNDKRGEVVSKILENCLEEEEFADFQYYIDMKTQLALMHAEIRDKVKMGEERLNTLTSTKIDWSIFSLT